MHSRNPYKVPPDFTSLAQSYPPLQQFLIDTDTSASKSSIRKTTIDFKNDRALRCLTQAIMYRDFGIQLQIPEDRLCPPVPNRMNYVLWIQDIMKANRTFLIEATSTVVRGIDVGTGATVIYPFLACSLEEGWEMTGTELDDKSYEYALRNIENNDMNGRITIKRAQANGSVLFPLEDEGASYDFTMCNPPFYSSRQEMDDLSKEKDGTPNAACTGSDIEMIYSGGEVGFVIRMVEESVRFQGRCKWYTSMLGKMSSVVHIIDLFRKRNISNYAVTEFVQGRTKRWAIGWSFLETRLPDSISRISLHQSHPLASYMPVHTTLRQPLRLSPTTKSEDVISRLLDVLRAIEDVRLTEHHRPSLFRIEAKENSWSRSARRRGKRRKLETDDTGRPDNGEQQDLRRNSSLKLVCDVHIILLGNPTEYEDSRLDLRVHPKSGTNVWAGEEIGRSESHNIEHNEDPGFSLECQWVFGTEYRVFETFAGHVGRKLIECVHNV